jgi:hypothetical protein
MGVCGGGVAVTLETEVALMKMAKGGGRGGLTISEAFQSTSANYGPIQA